MKYIFIGSSLLLLFSCGSARKIVDRPIVFDEERIELTQQYLIERYGLQQAAPTIIPKMVVIHWTEIPTMEKSFEAFQKSTLPNWRPDIEAISGLNVSSQFLVDRDGTIFRLMPETTMARHVIGLNHAAIGIENVGGTEETPLTKAQIRSNIWLVIYLAKKYPIEYLIGHYEYTNFEGHPLWLEKDEGYRTEKVDPGENFLNAVKKRTRYLHLKSTPIKTKSK